MTTWSAKLKVREFDTRRGVNVGWMLLLVGVIGLQFRFEAQGQNFPAQKDPPPAITSNSIWLNENGIQSSVEAFRRYFDRLGGSERDFTAVDELISLLSSEDYQTREQATNTLKTIPSLSVSELERLASEPSRSPEGRYRLMEVMRIKQEQDPAQLQYAIFCDIRDRGLHGLVDSILQSFESLERDAYVRHASIQALLVTAKESDLEILSRVLVDSTNTADIRAGALMCICKLSPEVARTQVLQVAPELLTTAEGVLGREVARVLVMNEDPAAFDVLYRLLRDKELLVRSIAIATLVRMTGLEFDQAEIPGLDRADAVEQKTRSWLEENPNDINYQWYEVFPRIGRRLVCQYDVNRVIELDDAGKIVWSTPAEKPFACLGLPNGHRFILLYTQGTILEYDGAGRLFKKLEGLPSNISGICRRENGNLILAAGQNGNMIVEIDSAGKQVNTFTLEGKPTSVEIGLNGNLIVSLYGSKKIAEVDANGNIVKEIELDGAPYHATPLITGNFLVAFAQDRRIIECDPEGKIVLTIDCKKYAYHAQKLEDGTISFADETGIYRVDEKGNEIISQTFKSVGKVNYIYSY